MQFLLRDSQISPLSARFVLVRSAPRERERKDTSARSWSIIDSNISGHSGCSCVWKKTHRASILYVVVGINDGPQTENKNTSLIAGKSNGHAASGPELQAEFYLMIANKESVRPFQEGHEAHPGHLGHRRPVGRRPLHRRVLVQLRQRAQQGKRGQDRRPRREPVGAAVRLQQPQRGLQGGPGALLQVRNIVSTKNFTD